jgi:NADH-quinone oxidoreductase subunit L
MFAYAWLVPGLPLFGALFNGILGRYLPRKVVGAVACALVAGAFGVSVAVFLELMRLAPGDRHATSLLYNWIFAGRFSAGMSILIDPLSVFMMLIVTGVGFLIHVYSTGYMGEDEGYSRFFTYMNLFVASMLILVMADNYLLMFVGWELVGICSFLLISFWYHKPEAVAAGRKAFITTRIGDVGFTLGVILIFLTFGTLAFGPVFAAAPGIAKGTLVAITVLLFIGAVGKSAQIPLYVWLPDAMEGPTPVSALIHAATMVTAGVYLVARSSPMFVEVPAVLTLVATIGAVTALFAATIALVNNDIKRVLAYSTISQIGYMFVGVGVGAFAAGLFHLLTHAFFKALLFLSAGSVMHALNGETDLRQMGGLKRKMPATYWTMLIASLAIAGIPPLSGFFSKDEILLGAFSGGHPIIYALGLATSLLTAFYMFRLFFKTFHGEPRMTEERWEHAHESPGSMTTPLVLLAIGAAIAGFVGVPEFLGGGDASWTNLVGRYLSPSLAVGEHASASTALAWGLMSAAVAVGVIGILAAWRLYVVRPGTAAKLAQRMPAAYNTLANKYWVDEAYNALFVNPGKAFARALWKVADAGLIDGAVNGLARAIGGLSLIGRKLETGYIRNYALAIFVGAIVLIGYLVVGR